MLVRILAALLLSSSIALAQEKTYTITVTASQVVTIGNALSERPWKETNALINSIAQQISAQDKPATPPPAVEDKKE
jgi:hypothetical protein